MPLASPSSLLQLLLALMLCMSVPAVPGPANAEERHTHPANILANSSPIPAHITPRIHDGADPSRSLRLHARAGQFAVTWAPGIVPNAMEGVPAPNRRFLELPPALAEDLDLGPSPLRLELVEAAGAPRFNTDIFALPDTVELDLYLIHI